MSWMKCAVLWLMMAVAMPLGGREALRSDIATVRESALKGEPAAQFKLGQAFEDGTGVDQDARQAADWYQKAAQQGYADAMFRLGLLYGRGSGITKDIPEALKWLRQANDKGHPNAKLYLQIYGSAASPRPDVDKPGLARATPQDDSLPAFPSNRLAIAVLGFPDRVPSENTAHWAHAFPSLLRMTVASCRAVRVIRRNDIEFAYKRLKLDPARPLDAVTARQAGQLLEARRVVWGHYQKQGERWIVKAWVMPVAEGKPGPEIQIESTDWQEITSGLVLKVLVELGVSPTDDERRQITRLHTSSLEALELFGKAVVAHNLLRPEPEIEAGFRKALAADPSFWLAQSYLPMPLASQGRFKEAREAARRAADMNPANASGHAVLAALLLMDPETRQQAEPALRQAIRLEPTEPESWARLAQLYHGKEENERRLACLLLAARLSPASAEIHAALADAYARKPDREKALAEIALAESLNDDDINCLQGLSLAYSALRDIPGALQNMDRLVARGRALGLNPGLVARFAEQADTLRQTLTAHAVAATRPRTYPATAYEAELRRRLTTEEVAQVANPLAGTPQMKPWAEAATRGATNQFDRACRLVDVLFRQLEFGRQRTRTAAEVFADMERPGSRFVCADLAVLYVALGRALGLDAFLVHVDRNHQDVPVRHDCAVVFLDGKAYLADPTGRWFGAPHKQFQVLDDLQSTCHYIEHTASDAAMVRIAAKLDPESPGQQFQLAMALADELKWEEANATLEAALRRDSRSWISQYAQGRFKLARGDAATAEVYFRKGAKLLPTQPDLQFILGELLLKRDQLAEARDCYRNAVALSLTLEKEDHARQRIAEINERLGAD
jgi:tetratricopeptide (TPR) repeat protein